MLISSIAGTLNKSFEQILSYSTFFLKWPDKSSVWTDGSFFQFNFGQKKSKPVSRGRSHFIEYYSVKTIKGSIQNVPEVYMSMY